MTKFNQYLKVNKYFIFLSFIYIIFTSIYILSTPKGAFLLWLNSNHNIYLDYFFYIFTFIGDGLFVIFLVLIFTLIKYKNSLNLFLNYALSGIFAQLLKIALNTPRPKAYFAGIAQLHFVPWVDVYSTYSMPSGHSTSAFALAYFLSTLFKNKILQTIIFLLAIIVAISRIYLCQHFPEDTIVGAFIGTTIAILSDFYFGDMLNKIEKLNNGLFRKNKLRTHT